ncbi:MAG: D-glycero-beta-D-manno-heptose 1-phosphate adenylyltransferase [Nitrospirae bacterium]|nr:MAG: Cytidylyltransferase family protein [Leptospirillum sp. Group IV 'UBA BS']MCL4485886.1 D-glycero-beta-D-manno-heptose 1-phosphate adenylyltransferase [Nitrospirota bacterium]MCL5285315.1 D-glycero-beta-D-manno-heptose 1-phosphate adenylyltransferase [Nitrospirota bacterium]
MPMDPRPPLFSSSKILDPESLLPVLERHKLQGEKIVFTNGCFDLLHAGHVEVLEQARSLGDILVVALNTDRSVATLKGPLRPIVPQANRARVMASLACVSYVTFFDSETPEDLIRRILPDVLVKGGDWSIDRIVGGRMVLERGGEVRSIPLVPDSSTTGLIERIIDRYSRDRG